MFFIFYDFFCGIIRKVFPQNSLQQEQPGAWSLELRAKMVSPTAMIFIKIAEHFQLKAQGSRLTAHGSKNVSTDRDCALKHESLHQSLLQHLARKIYTL